MQRPEIASGINLTMKCTLKNGGGIFDEGYVLLIMHAGHLFLHIAHIHGGGRFFIRL